MNIVNLMTPEALEKAQLKVYNVVQNGSDIILLKADKNKKDEYGESLGDSELPFKAFPVRFTPFDRDTRQRISWAENVEVIVFISMYEVNQNNLTTARLKRYTSFKFNKQEYDITHVDNYMNFGTGFLYVVIGGKK